MLGPCEDWLTGPVLIDEDTVGSPLMIGTKMAVLGTSDFVIDRVGREDSVGEALDGNNDGETDGESPGGFGDLGLPHQMVRSLSAFPLLLPRCFKDIQAASQSS